MSVLEFRGARLEVRLGCSAEERARPQPVDLDLAVRFKELPAACTSDRLEDTLCYAELIEAARKACAGREFRLVERLAHELFGRLRPLVPEGAELWLRATKLRPPIDGLHGGVAFSLGDFEGLAR
ncbi:MAG: dihydroneopterin aldolase [Myxococcota bacterium]